MKQHLKTWGAIYIIAFVGLVGIAIGLKELFNTLNNLG